MNRNQPLSLLILLALGAVGLSLLFQHLLPVELAEEGDPIRIVSLSPAITETLHAIGAGDRLVGRSDYCDYPPEVLDLPPMGTTLQPVPEAIARISPDHIFMEGTKGVPPSSVRAIASTTVLPWLSLSDVTKSIRRLGELTDTVDNADALAMKLAGKLDVPAAKIGPRLLLVLGMPRGNSIWYVQKNSLHGRAVHTIGWRNAVDGAIEGPPAMSFERLMEIDPELIVVMIARDQVTDIERQAHVDVFERFPMLTAVKTGRVGTIVGSRHFRPGPRILEFIEVLRTEVSRLTSDKSDVP